MLKEKSLYFKNLAESLKISEKEEKDLINNAGIKESSEENASIFKCFLCKKLAHNLKICGDCDDGAFC